MRIAKKAATPATTGGFKSLLDDGQTEGPERLFEALQANLWDNMIRKESGRGAAKLRSTAEIAAQYDETKQRPSSDSSASAAAERELVSTPTDAPASDSGAAPEPAPAPASQTAPAKPSSDPSSVEASLEQFESIMERMKAFRASGAASAGGMSDQERRAAAAEMLMQALGVLGFDDDEEEGADVSDRD